MDLKTINQEYLNLKEQIKNCDEKTKQYAETLEKLSLEKKIYEGERARAMLDNNAQKIQEANQKIENCKNKIMTIKESASNQKKNIELAKQKIDQRVQELTEEPEMKKHLQEVMTKKYSRKIKALKDEKNNKENELKKTESLEVVISYHPKIKNYLNGIANSLEEKAKCEKELETLKQSNNPNKQKTTELLNKIKKANSKINQNKSVVMSFLKKQKLEFSEQDLQKIFQGGIKRDNEGNIDLRANINKINRQIKGIDKSIKDHEIAMNKYQIKVQEQATEEQSYNQQNQGKIAGFFKKIWTSITNRISRKRLPEATQKTPNEESNEAKSNNTEKDNFLDSLKYDIVSEYVQNKQVNDLKEAKKERKNLVQENNQEHDYDRNER